MIESLPSRKRPSTMATGFGTSMSNNWRPVSTFAAWLLMMTPGVGDAGLRCERSSTSGAFCGNSLCREAEDDSLAGSRASTGAMAFVRFELSGVIDMVILFDILQFSTQNTQRIVKHPRLHETSSGFEIL